MHAYLVLCVILTYSKPYHILSPAILRTGDLTKTLWNGDQAYSELCQKALFSHIEA